MLNTPNTPQSASANITEDADKARLRELAESQPVPLENVRVPKELPTSQLRPVPAFDRNKLLPECLRWWIMDEASRSGAPEEFVAVSALVSACAIISPKVRFQPKRHDTQYTIIPNLWGTVIGMPSSKKTPGIKSGMRHINAIQAEESERKDREQREHDRQKTVLQTKVAVAKEKLKKLIVQKEKAPHGTDPTQDDIEAAQEQLMQAEEALNFTPSGRSYISNDSTVEALGVLLADSPGILQYRDELTGWLNNLNREDRANDRSFFLEAFSGGDYKYNRIGRGELYIKQNIVSVLGGIQRDRIKPLVRGAVRGDLDNDGLLARFQLMVYPDYAWAAGQDRTPHADSQLEAEKVFQQLAMMPVWGLPIKLTEPAYDVYWDWKNPFDKRIKEQYDDNAAVQSHLGKYDKLCIGIAGLFAVIDANVVGVLPHVDVQHIQRGIAWCELMEEHALRVYGLVDDQEIELARLIFSRKEKLADAGGFTMSELKKTGWSGVGDAEAVRSALAVLVDYGYIFEKEVQTGGRPRIAYFWSDY